MMNHRPTATAPTPPACADVEQTTALRDAPALARMVITRWTYAARQAKGLSVLWCAYLAVVAAVLYPVIVLPSYAVALRSPWRTFYVLRDERGRVDVALSIAVAAPHRWIVKDHISRHPGTGRGRELRDRLVPTLLEAADRDQVTVEAQASTTGLAAIYRASCPGLTDVGAGILGPRLRRRPVG